MGATFHVLAVWDSLMPAPTYDLIEEKVLGSAQASVTFSSIPGTYKDLVLEVVGTTTNTNGTYITLRFNSDSNSNYSETLLVGNGTSALSERDSNVAVAFTGWQGNNVSVVNINIMSYANTNVYKTVLTRGGSDNNRVTASVALWRSTAAITSIEAKSNNGTNSFNSGCTFRLWGVSG